MIWHTDRSRSMDEPMPSPVIAFIHWKRSSTKLRNATSAPYTLEAMRVSRSKRSSCGVSRIPHDSRKSSRSASLAGGGGTTNTSKLLLKANSFRKRVTYVRGGIIPS